MMKLTPDWKKYLFLWRKLWNFLINNAPTSIPSPYFPISCVHTECIGDLVQIIWTESWKARWFLLGNFRPLLNLVACFELAWSLHKLVWSLKYNHHIKLVLLKSLIHTLLCRATNVNLSLFVERKIRLILNATDLE